MKIPAHELKRKAIHLTSLLYPLLYLITGNRIFMLALTGTLLLGLLTIDFLKRYNATARSLFQRYFGFALRNTELTQMTGSTYFMAGTFLSILWFSQAASITGLFILIISDTAASLIGMRYGRIKILGSKTLEGYLGFLSSAVVIATLGALFFHSSVHLFIWAAAVSSVLELISRKIRIDDNLLIPLGFCLIASL